MKVFFLVLLFVGTLFWGMTFVFIKDGLQELSVYTFLGYRFLVATIVMIIIFRKKLPALNYDLLKVGTLQAILLLLAFITQTTGMKYTTATKGGFISGLSVVLVPLFLAIIQKKLPQKEVLLAVVIATFGLILMTLEGGTLFNIGDLWILACAVFFAFYIILVGRYSKVGDPVLLVIIQFIIVTTLSLTVAAVNNEIVIPVQYKSWQAIIFTSIFATAFMYTVQNYSQKFISEITTAIIFSFEPFFAAITAFIYLNEPLTLKMIAGGILIFTGVLLVELDLSKLKRFLI